jgi:hypothetical protein
VSTHRRVNSTAKAVNDIVEIAQSAGATLLLSPRSRAGRKKKS